MPFSLSFHTYKDYWTCPEKCRRLLNKDPQPPQDKRKAFYGIFMQSLYENFILSKERNLMWFSKNFWKIFQDVEKSEKIKWGDDKERDTMSELCKESLPNLKNLLFEVDMWKESLKTEIPIKIPLNDDITMTGRWDFECNGIIADAKGSKYGKGGVDKGQLLWYSWQHYLTFGKRPEHLYFLFFHPKQNKIWEIVPTDDELNEFKEKIIEMCMCVNQKLFPPTPNYKGCLFCQYVRDCTHACRGKNIPPLTLDIQGVSKDGIFEIEL